MKKAEKYLRIGYSGTVLKKITMGLFKYAMDSVTIQMGDDGNYNVCVLPKKKQRVEAFLRYLKLDYSDLVRI